MARIDEIVNKKKRKETVIQFGEGGFLRGFADWMLQKLNESGKYEGSVVVVQPIEKGMCDKLSEQNCVYTHVMRGIENGKSVVRKDKIDVILLRKMKVGLRKLIEMFRKKISVMHFALK